ncbi:lysophospholipid acyltransferase family protein [Phenylobacterium sp. LH3H17]|uniref:lysophospholipid acyltransferase family protein n=1 Tax=Phenylobacterium sp. LH3H17 TaxID=2903901 RepID=UPI0020C9D870|nr:lysophospholipid acyltransferase family protein [Phenylobacterium sp. LH3H17]UTP40424.1 lysophospholipid acyltransferase family protein [Phenylobacterium sp. LH3H17]
MTQAGPSRWQDFLWRLEALAFDAVILLARALPVDAVSDFGAWFFKTLGPLTSAHRVAETNLRIVFPQASDAEIRRLLRAQWDNTGRTFLELLIMDRIIGDPDRVEVVNAARLRQIAAKKEPVVFVSGHFSNFEVMPAVIVNSPVVSQITYRAMNNPYVEARVRDYRFRYGVRYFAPKGGDGARELLAALGRGESVALMNDQKFNGGVAAPFFGRTVHTAPGPSRLALRFDTVLQPMSVQRKHKARFRVVVHDPIALTKTGDMAADIEAGVRKVNAFIEAQVLQRPAEWFWTHRRWPSEVYKRAR